MRRSETAATEAGMNRILVIRGGAIGDFILTLPALKALREANPGAHIEILGYAHIAELARNRFYANRVRSIEYGPLSRFFARDSELSPELSNYFGSFNLAVSYLYDPDLIFENNLRKCDLQNIVHGPGRIRTGKHAVWQLARPIEKLGLDLADAAPRLYPSIEDRQVAKDVLGKYAEPLVALHPGSGSEKKNWPIDKWIELGNTLLGSGNFHGTILVVAGEADDAQTAGLESVWRNPQVRFAKNLPLPHLAALLESSTFIGHDSGISHLAAAAGADCILLFGPTDPAVWAPLNKNVIVVRAPEGDLRILEIETVRKAAPIFSW